MTRPDKTSLLYPSKSCGGKWIYSPWKWQLKVLVMTANFSCPSWWWFMCSLTLFMVGFLRHQRNPSLSRKVTQVQKRKPHEVFSVKAGSSWRFVGHSGIFPSWSSEMKVAQVWEQIPLEKYQPQTIWQLCRHRVIHVLRQIHFSQLAYPASKDNLWVAIISCLSNYLGPSTTHSSAGQLVMCHVSQRAAPLGHHRSCFLPSLHVYPKIWRAGCAGPPGKDRDKAMALYIFWPAWEKASQLSSPGFCTRLAAAEEDAPVVSSPKIRLEPMSGMNKYSRD